MCNCLLSTRIEREIFSNKNPLEYMDDIPNDDCPICLESLKIRANVCCGGYARSLKCGHYVHVSCQINHNPDLRQCPICRAELTNADIYYRIMRRFFISKLPIHYQSKLSNNDILSENEIDNLQKYGIVYQQIKTILDGLDTIRTDTNKTKNFFSMIWRKNI